VTIGSAFACLTWTDFRAFREFGVLAAAGVVFVLAAYVLLLPALLGLVARFAPRLSEAPRGLTLPGVGLMHRFAPAIFWVLLAGCFASLTQLPRAHFDADFSRLDDADLPSFRRDKEVNALLGRSQTPMVVLAESPEQSREVAAAVRERMRALGADATIGLTATRADLLPGDQAAKEPVLREIGRMLSRLHPDKLDAQTRERLEKLRAMSAAAPFTAADLPASLRQVFEPKAGSGPVDFVLLYPTVSTGDAAAVRRLAAQLRHIELPSGAVVSAAGEPMVLADVLATVERDAPRIVLLTALLVLIALRATLGKTRLALLSISPALLTVAVTVGLCPLLGIDINYLNMIILPILLGVGVDDGAHLVARVDAGESLPDVWRHTGWDVTGAILTDAFGFGVLALAAHPGLASLGKLALVGLTVNWLVCIVLLPAALALLPLVGNARRRASPSSWLATAGGAGWSPVAPGTIGALVALPLAWLIRDAGPAVRVLAALLVSVAAIAVTSRYLRERGSPKDPQEIVVDELAGCFVALCFVPFELPWIAGAFLLFRAFDILKPGPVRWAERRLPGSYGVVVDDLVAGAMAGALLLFLGRALA
jgi:phosphatidylglycerophosphatase A